MALKDRVAARMAERGLVHADGRPNARAAVEPTGLAYATIHGVLNGNIVNPSRDTLEKLAGGLGTTVDWLLAGERGAGTFEQGAEFVLQFMREAVRAAEDEVRRLRRPAPKPEAGTGETTRGEVEDAAQIVADLDNMDNRQRAAGE